MDILQRIFDLCKAIYKWANNAKANKDRCQRVAERVKALESLVEGLTKKEPDQISSTVLQALEKLCETLESAEKLVKKFHKSNAIECLVKSSSYEDKFNNINDELNDSFQVLSGALQIEQRDMLKSLCSKKGSVNEGNGPAQTSPLPFPMPEPWHATKGFSLAAQSHPTVPMSPQSPPFSPTAPYPPQAQQFRPPAPLPPQAQQFRPPGPLPPQAQQFRPPAPLPPQTQQFRPPGPLPPQAQQFRPQAPFIPTTPAVPPAIPRSNPTSAVPAPHILSPMSGPISTVPHHFPASVPAGLLNPGNVASMSGAAIMNITIRNTTVVTHYPANNPGFQ